MRRPSVHPKYPKAYLSYVCGGRKDNVRRCDLRPISTPKLDVIVWEWMKEVLLNPDEIEAELREQMAHRQEKLAELDVERERLYQRKVEIDNELTRLLELYTRGSLPIELLDAKAIEKRTMMQAIQEAIDHNERQRQTPLTDDHVAALRALAEELQRGINEAENSFTARRHLVEVMDVRVEILWENQEIWLRLTSDLGEGVKRFASRSL